MQEGSVLKHTYEITLIPFEIFLPPKNLNPGEASLQNEI